MMSLIPDINAVSSMEDIKILVAYRHTLNILTIDFVVFIIIKLKKIIYSCFPGKLMKYRVFLFINFLLALTQNEN